MKPTPNTITALEPNQILVFGSNTQGRHRAGLAKVAVQFGAEDGNPIGRQGQTYAIVTKDLTKPRTQQARSVPLSRIGQQIHQLCRYAKAHPDLEFLVTRIGCGLAGYTDAEIVGLWKDRAIPTNVRLPQEFLDAIALEPASLITIVNQSKSKSKEGIRGDRASVLGNPFDMGKDEGLRDRVCDAYEAYFQAVLDGAEPSTAADEIADQAKLKLASAWKRPSRTDFMAEVDRIEALISQGKPIKLLCWCAPCRCHLDTVKNYLDQQTIKQNPLETLLPLNAAVTGSMKKDRTPEDVTKARQTSL